MRRPATFAAAALAALPVLHLGLTVWRSAVDVPFGDQWFFVELLRKAYAGTFTPADLWAPTNEHRHLFPLAVLVPLALLTHWDTRWEMALSVLSALLTLLGLAGLARNLHRQGGPALLPQALPVLALLVCSCAAWENWLVGSHLVIFMNVCAAVHAFRLLTTPALGTRGVAGAGALALVAHYSFSNGLLAWPIGLGLLLARSDRPWGLRLRWAGAWTGAALLALGTYLAGFERPAHHRPLGDALQRPLDFVYYVFCFYGAPLFDVDFRAAFVGLALVGSVALCTLRLRRAGLSLPALLPLLAPAAYAAASGLGIALARAWMGGDQALSPRYITVSSLLAAAAALALLAEAARGTQAARLALVVLAALGVLATLRGAGHMRQRHEDVLPAVRALHRWQPGLDRELARRVDPRGVDERDRAFLLERRLTFFRTPPP